MNLAKTILLTTVLMAVSASGADKVPAIPRQVFASTHDYGFMRWENGTASQSYKIITSRYAMSFQVADFELTSLVPLKDPAKESEVSTNTNYGLCESAPPVAFACNLICNGETNRVLAAKGGKPDVQLVESGKFFQRRWHKVRLAGGAPLDEIGSGLEIAAWPDRISLVLRLVPGVALTNATLEMTLSLTNSYGTPLTNGSSFGLQAADGSGFAFLRSADAGELTINPAKGLVTIRTGTEIWRAGQERSVGVIIYPTGANTAAVLAQAEVAETSPLTITSTGIVPAMPRLAAVYDIDRGFYRIALSTNESKGPDDILRAQVSIINPTSSPRVVRLNFDGLPFSVVGLTAVLRDETLNPMGIPVQLSKNWHTQFAGKFMGPWFHGLTMLNVPAKQTLQLELAMVGQNWGGLPAATQTQLCVIGYGGNQQWNEAALGNYGEALCYDVDHVLTDNDCTDSRPILQLNAMGERGAWTINAGGASFFRYFDAKGRQQRHSQMRTRYLRYCPNLAETQFAGESEDKAVDSGFSAALFRSDDYTRAIHRLRIDVKTNISFSRLVFFQQAADTYHYNQGRTFAYGDAAHLQPMRQWSATVGQNKYIGTPVALSGPMSWAAILDSTFETQYTPANHGFIIRSWKARINGSNNVPPYLAERSLADASILDLVPPPGVTELKAGDYVEAEIERFYLPKYAKDYYGPNRNFHEALNQYQNSGQLAIRESVGNRVRVDVQTGVLEHSYPVQIHATHNHAAFVVTGGLGFVPFTFTALSAYRDPVLEEFRGGAWKRINQSVHGKDFWQCDYNAESDAWEITFNVNLDSSAYQDIASLMTAPTTRSFRFAVGETNSSSSKQ